MGNDQHNICLAIDFISLADEVFAQLVQKMTERRITLSINTVTILKHQRKSADSHNDQDILNYSHFYFVV